MGDKRLYGHIAVGAVMGGDLLGAIPAQSGVAAPARGTAAFVAAGWSS